MAGLYLAEEHRLAKHLAKQSADGVAVRLLFGDPEGKEISERSLEEDLGDKAMGSRIMNALAFDDELADSGAADIRLHDTTLYHSILR